MHTNWSQPNSITFGGAFFGDYRLRNVWGNHPIDHHYNTTNSSGKPLILVTITLERDDSNRLPITWALIALFFTLGATLFIEPKENLNDRVTIFLTILVFAIGFFFSLGSLIPFRFGFTIAEMLILSLVVGSAIFTIGSFASKAVSSIIENRYVGIIIDLVAVLVFFLVLLQFGIFFYSPVMLRIPIIVGIWYGLAFRSAIVAIKERKRARARGIWNVGYE